MGNFQVWIGGALLAAAVVAALIRRGGDWIRARKNAPAGGTGPGELKWRVIDNSRPVRDCQTDASQGVCTGLECYDYAACHFAIRKPPANT